MWDGDLIPLRRWKLCERSEDGSVRYYIAILQAESRSVFNTSQYAACMHALCGFWPMEPDGGGTFVAHHMIFHSDMVTAMLRQMVEHTGSNLPWPRLIMSQSKQFYRFSEYKTYASFVLHRRSAMSADSSIGDSALQERRPPVDGTAPIPAAFQYHLLKTFGSGGIRFRGGSEVVEEMIRFCGVIDGGIPYNTVRQFVKRKWVEMAAAATPRKYQPVLHVPDGAHLRDVCGDSEDSLLITDPIVPAYLQLDHVYGLDGVDLNLSQPSMSQSGSTRKRVDSKSSRHLLHVVVSGMEGLSASQTDAPPLLLSSGDDEDDRSPAQFEILPEKES